MKLRRPPRDQRPIADATILATRWHDLLATEPYRHRCLWLLFLDPGRRPAGPVLLVEDLPDGPYDFQVADLVALCREILDGPGTGSGTREDGRGAGSVAFLLSRPGGLPWTVSDRAWCRFLTRASETVGGQQWPVRFAHRYGVAAVADVLAPTTTGSTATLV